MNLNLSFYFLLIVVIWKTKSNCNKQPFYEQFKDEKKSLTVKHCIKFTIKIFSSKLKTFGSNIKLNNLTLADNDAHGMRVVRNEHGRVSHISHNKLRILTRNVQDSRQRRNWKESQFCAR